MMMAVSCIRTSDFKLQSKSLNRKTEGTPVRALLREATESMHTSSTGKEKETFDPDENYVDFSLSEQDLLHKYFDVHDVDDDGGLSTEELVAIFGDMHREPAKGSADAVAFN